MTEVMATDYETEHHFKNPQTIPLMWCVFFSFKAVALLTAYSVDQIPF